MNILRRKLFYDIKGVKKNSYGMRAYIVIAILFGMIAITGVLLFTNDYSKKLSEERCENLTELGNNKAELTKNTIDSSWQYLLSLKQVVVRNNITNEKVLLESIDEITQRIVNPNIEMLVIDDKGYYYGQKKIKARLYDEDKLEFLKSKKQRVVTIESIKEFDNEKYIAYAEHLDEPVKLDNGRQIIYVVYALKLDRFIKDFDIGDYVKKNNMLIKRGDEVLYVKDGIKGLDPVDDMSKLDGFLENFELHDKSKEEPFKNQVKNNKCATIELHYKDNKRYFLIYTPIDIDGWSVMHLIPRDGIIKDGFSVRNFTAYIITAIVVTIGFFVLVLIYISVILNRYARVINIQDDTNMILKKTAEDAKAANEAKSSFLSHISHDIRTPINGIQGMTDIARENIDDKDKVMDCLSKIKTSSGYLVSLVNDVLDMSRIETGKLEIKNEPMSIEKLYEECVSIIDTHSKKNNINFIHKLKLGGHSNVYGDILHLKQIFVNILGNAIKFSKPGGDVLFIIEEVEQINNKVLFEFTIEDYGMGMSKEFQEKIYEPFSQEEDNSRTKYKGTGLGMAIAKECIDMMGGTITLTSEIEKGSKFVVTVTFDICEGELAEDFDISEYSFRDVKALVVEDNEINMEIMESILELLDINVVTATNGKEAVEILETSKENEYDIVFMDIMMPVMDGYEATKIIKESDRAEISSLPIVAMSANAYGEDVRKSAAVGMYAHLAKPIDNKKLYSILNDILKK